MMISIIRKAKNEYYEASDSVIIGLSDNFTVIAQKCLSDCRHYWSSKER